MGATYPIDDSQKYPRILNHISMIQDALVYEEALRHFDAKANEVPKDFIEWKKAGKRQGLADADVWNANETTDVDKGIVQAMNDVAKVVAYLEHRIESLQEKVRQLEGR